MAHWGVAVDVVGSDSTGVSEVALVGRCGASPENVVLGQDLIQRHVLSLSEHTGSEKCWCSRFPLEAFGRFGLPGINHDALWLFSLLLLLPPLLLIFH